MGEAWTEDKLSEAIAANTSWTGVLRHLGFSYSGGALKQAKRKADEFGLDTSHFKGRGWRESAAEAKSATTGERLTALETKIDAMADDLAAIRRMLEESQPVDDVLFADPIPVTGKDPLAEIKAILDEDDIEPLSEHLDGWGQFNNKQTPPDGWVKMKGDGKLLEQACKGLGINYARLAIYKASSYGRYDEHTDFSKDVIGVVVKKTDKRMVAKTVDLLKEGRLGYVEPDRWSNGSPKLISKDAKVTVIKVSK